jgi:hypothetical protein
MEASSFDPLSGRTGPSDEGTRSVTLAIMTTRPDAVATARELAALRARIVSSVEPPACPPGHDADP